MPTLILDQSDIPGTAFDGSKDGELLHDNSGWSIQAFNSGKIGHKWLIDPDLAITEQGLFEYVQCLRFLLPDSLFAENVTITNIRLKLHLDYNAGRSYDPVTDANTLTNGKVYCGLVNPFISGPFPYNSPSQYDAPEITDADQTRYFYFNHIYDDVLANNKLTWAEDRLLIADSSWVTLESGLSIVEINFVPSIDFSAYVNTPQDEVLGTLVFQPYKYLYNWLNVRYLGFSIFYKTPTYIDGDFFARVLTYSRIEKLILEGESTSLRDYYPTLEIDYTGDLNVENSYQDDLVIGQDISYVPIINQTLTIEQDISYSTDLARTVTDALVLDQEITYFGPYTASYIDDLILDQEITPSRVHGQSVESELNLDHEIEYRLPLVITVEQSLDIEQDVSGYLNKTYDQTVEHTLVLDQTVSYSGTVYHEVEHFLFIQQDVDINKTVELDIEHTLILDQDYSWSMPHTEQVTSDLTFEQDILLHAVHVLTVEHELSLIQTVTGFEDPVECIEDNINTTVTFEYLTSTLTLPAPDFGDRSVVNKQRINRQVHSGDTIIFMSDAWENDKTLRLSFSNLTEQQKDDYLAFIRLSLGRPIQYTDHFGAVFNCIMRSPTADIVTQKEPCSYTIQVELEII